MTEQIQKLRELILYITEFCEGDSTFSDVKLNKMLFIADVTTYLSRDRPITEAQYEHLGDGPAPCGMAALILDMEQRRELVLADRQYLGQPVKRPLALREADLDLFTASEIATVDHACCQYRNQLAREISTSAPIFIGWRMSVVGETIPYFAARFYTTELTQRQIETARTLDLTGVEELLNA